MKTHELFIPPYSGRWTAAHWLFYAALLCLMLSAGNFVAYRIGWLVSALILGR